MSEKLKACPFCGGKAQGSKETGLVRCGRCPMRLTTVKLWNTRTPDHGLEWLKTTQDLEKRNKDLAKVVGEVTKENGRLRDKVNLFSARNHGDIRQIELLEEWKKASNEVIKELQAEVNRVADMLEKQLANKDNEIKWLLKDADYQRGQVEGLSGENGGLKRENEELRKEIGWRKKDAKLLLKTLTDNQELKAENEKLKTSRQQVDEGKKNRPLIVCLCGSTRFMQEFFDAGWVFTLKNYIVLSVGVCKHVEHHGGEALGQEVADKLDVLHLRKIDLADEVYVLNVGGYIGKSTAKEITYAKSKNKPIMYLEALRK